MKLQNNTIYQYQGGGYSGCIWEWNFFFIDKTGNFHDIFSSGRSGITDMESAKCVEDTGKVYPYCIDSEKDLDELANETHGPLVSGLVTWFADNQNNEVYMICVECKEKIYDPDEAISHNQDILCDDCYSTGTCGCCGDYAGPGNLHYTIDLKNPPDCLSEFTDDVIAELSDNMENLDRCEFCLQNAAQEIENNGTQEALFLALLTGKGLFTTVRVCC